MNVYDQAHALARSMKESEEYREYARLREKAYEDETNKALLDEYKRLQYHMQLALAAGKRMEEDDFQRMQKIGAAGHTLAIHSYSHDYKKIYASVEAYLEDFNQMFCQIYEATGVKPQIFRFPGGSVNSYNVGIHQQLIAEMTRRGFVYFDWNVANGDAVFSKIQPSSTLTANALKGVGTARRAIILMHDSSAKTTTVEALPAIIEGYLEAGYSFAALTPSTRSVTFSYLD